MSNIVDDLGSVLISPYFCQMPAAPPSYDQVVGGGGLYPQVPEKGGPPPANYNPPGAVPPAYPQQHHVPMPPNTQVITQVQYVQAPVFGHRPVNMTCHHCQQNITTRLDLSQFRSLCCIF